MGYHEPEAHIVLILWKTIPLLRMDQWGAGKLLV